MNGWDGIMGAWEHGFIVSHSIMELLTNEINWRRVIIPAEMNFALNSHSLQDTQPLQGLLFFFLFLFFHLSTFNAFQPQP